MDCIAIIETVICLSQSYTVLLPICISCTKYKKFSEKFSKLSPTHFIVKHICTRSKRMAIKQYYKHLFALLYNVFSFKNVTDERMCQTNEHRCIRGVRVR